MNNTAGTWTQHLDEVMHALAATTVHGCPPPCAPAARFALDAYARCSGVAVPTEYHELLSLVNGFTWAPYPQLFGIGIPVLDEYERMDFLVANQPLRSGVRRTRVAFGRLSATEALAHLTDTGAWVIWNTAEEDVQQFETFGALLEVALLRALEDIPATAC